MKMTKKNHLSIFCQKYCDYQQLAGRVYANAWTKENQQHLLLVS